MLIVLICIVAGVLILGLYWGINERDIGSGLLGALLGFFAGAVVGIIFTLIVSGFYWSDNSHYLLKTETHQIEEYHTEDNDKKCYVHINNSDGQLITNVQYYDDEGTPQTLHLNRNVEYVYSKDRDPSITIKSYENQEQIWIFNEFATTPSNEYTIVVPDESAVYHNLN